MTPYFKFYSDLDLLMRQIEDMKDECHENWIKDEPFPMETPETWRDLEESLENILDILNDEPFFTPEENEND